MFDHLQPWSPNFTHPKLPAVEFQGSGGHLNKMVAFSSGQTSGRPRMEKFVAPERLEYLRGLTPQQMQEALATEKIGLEREGIDLEVWEE